MRIPPRSGTAFRLARGQRLKVIDPEGEQVSDLVAFNAQDTREALSNGRTIDYLEKIMFSTGDVLYSNRSSEMLKIAEDTVGVHDFLLSPCSKEMFLKTYGPEHVHPGCFGNLSSALAPHGIEPDGIPVAFNVFMNVPVDAAGRISVAPPKSRAGDYVIFEALMDLVVGMTACSAGLSNNFSYKPIDYEIL